MYMIIELFGGRIECDMDHITKEWVESVLGNGTATLVGYRKKQK